MQNPALEDLVDISELEIDHNLPVEQRRMEYIKKIKNPNMFRYKNKIIRARFQSEGPTIEDRLANLLG